MFTKKKSQNEKCVQLKSKTKLISKASLDTSWAFDPFVVNFVDEGIDSNFLFAPTPTFTYDKWPGNFAYFW